MKMLHGAQQLLAQLSSRYNAQPELRDLSGGMPVPRAKAQGADGEFVPLVRNRSDILRFSNAIITAFEEALSYEPLRRHNRPPPELWIEDPYYLDEIRKLTNELRLLNATLERIDSSSLRVASQRVGRIGRHFDEFFKSYASAMGKGAAGLTIAAVAALLYQAGGATEIIDSVWRHWKRD